MSARAPIWIAVLLLVGVGLFKPAHMDDPAFLRVARQIRSFPHDPYGFSWDYLGEPTPAVVGMPHPPLWPMLLALGMSVAGERLAILHLWNILLAVLLVRGAQKLYGDDPAGRRACWVVALSPVALVLADNLMSDFAALSFTMAGLGAWASAQRRGSAGAALAAGLWFAAAAWTRYPCLLIPPLLLLWRDERGRSRGRLALACGLPALAFAGLCAWTWRLYGEVHILAVLGHMQVEDRRAPLLRLISFAPALAITAPALVAAVPVRRWPLLLATAVAAGALGWWGGGLSASAHGIHYDHLHLILLVSLSALGGLLLAAAWCGDGSRFARAWLVLVASGIAVASPAGAARYLLPLLPVLVWCARDRLGRLGRARWTGAIAVQAVLALALVVTDLRAARLRAQTLASDLPLVSLETGRPAWLRGELAFRYFLERAGARYLDAHDSSARPGDLLLLSSACTPARSRFERRVQASIPARPLAVVLCRDRWPLRLHDAHAGAGFYGHKAGLLPFAFSRCPHDRIEVLRLRSLSTFLDLGRAEWLGVEDALMAREFERYGRVRNVRPAPTLERRAALCLVARRAARGWMGLRYRVDLGARRYLRGLWAEPDRLALEGVAGRASVGTIRVHACEDDSRVLELRRVFRSRSEVSERRWHPFEMDLAPLGGREVWIEIRCSLEADEGDRAVAYLIVADLRLEKPLQEEGIR